MVTKEHKSKKYCCFYVSQFHLDMILLPYIKENLQKYKINIFTQEDLLESMKVLLERTNLKAEEKNEILKLNWNKTKLEDISIYDFNKNISIINGNTDYIFKVNEKLRNLNNVNIVDCYDVSKDSVDVKKIQVEYNEILNTKRV